MQEDGCPLRYRQGQVQARSDHRWVLFVLFQNHYTDDIGKKTSAAVAITDVRSEDQQALANLVSASKANYLEKSEELRRHWGGGIRGNKS